MPLTFIYSCFYRYYVYINIQSKTDIYNNFIHKEIELGTDYFQSARIGQHGDKHGFNRVHSNEPIKQKANRVDFPHFEYFFVQNVRQPPY